MARHPEHPGGARVDALAVVRAIPLHQDQGIHAVQLGVARHHAPGEVPLQRREAEDAAPVVAEDELHGAAAEAAEAVVEEDGHVGHGKG